MPSPPPSAVIGGIACAVLEQEIRALAKNRGDLYLHFMPQGLHNTPSLLRSSVQSAIDALENISSLHTIVLVYGLCSRGVEGLVARRVRLVLPRAHDCITLLLGSKNRYEQYVREHPGTYWYSPGWNRHHLPPGEERYRRCLADYRSRFSEEDARYLMENEQAWFSAYNRAAFIDLGITEVADEVAYTRCCAQWLGWSFDRQIGDPTLLADLLDANEDPERFLLLLPGQTPRFTPDDRIMVPLTLRGHAVEHSHAFAP